MMSGSRGVRFWQFEAVVSLLVLMCSSVNASVVLEDFESGSLPSGWTVTSAVGTSWKVGGATGTSPNIAPPQGSYFARSGEPNSATESDTGILTSPAYTVTHTTLDWLSSGWSAGPGGADGNSYFQILDSTLSEKAKVNPAQSDGWSTFSVNLLDIGLLPGATFYFRAVDGRNQSNYGWFAFDELQLTGDEVAPPGTVPEPTSVLVWTGLGLACIGTCKLRSSRSG